MADDVRAKRAQRVKDQRAKLAVRSLSGYRNYLIGAVVVVAVIGAVLAIPSNPERFVHGHVSFAMFIQGEQVRFDNPEYDSTHVHGTAHMHFNEPGGGYIWHVEANFPNGKLNIPVSQYFEQFGFVWRDGLIKLDTRAGHNGSEWRDQGGSTWRLHVSKFVVDERKPYQPVEDYVNYQPQDLDKFLITYGDDALLTEAELARQQAVIPAPHGEPQPRAG